ncbi:MAG TPA: type II toxin-antitoxin system ParD family antitoxin [Flavobacteriales bacterium]|nr:type II toxin-antitoxin system ParD family antitoxin [Flavobacteriales bacterium]
MKYEVLIKALEKGERSGFIDDFNRDQFLKGLHRNNGDVLYSGNDNG